MFNNNTLKWCKMLKGLSKNKFFACESVEKNLFKSL